SRLARGANGLLTKVDRPGEDAQLRACLRIWLLEESDGTENGQDLNDGPANLSGSLGSVPRELELEAPHVISCSNLPTLLPLDLAAEHERVRRVTGGCRLLEARIEHSGDAVASSDEHDEGEDLLQEPGRLAAEFR